MTKIYSPSVLAYEFEPATHPAFVEVDSIIREL
jgi:hypothetical protein